MATQIKNMAYWKAKNCVPGINYDFEKGNLPDGRSPSTAFQKKGGKDCTCWKGYERVKGTEPCADNSCEKA